MLKNEVSKEDLKSLRRDQSQWIIEDKMIEKSLRGKRFIRIRKRNKK